MNKQTTIILADDHPLLRRGLKEIIVADTSLSVIGDVGDGESAFALIERERPGIAVLDIDMPKMNGLDVAREVQKRKLQTDVIILTMYDKENIFQRAMDLGVRGYVMKDSATTEIVAAIHTVRAGKHYITPVLSGFLLKRGNLTEGVDKKLGLSTLTQTERKVLKFIAAEKSSKDIAEELFLSVRTVETHRNNICTKLNLHGANALLRFALEHREII